MTYPVLLPQLTETMEEATIVNWFKQPGDRIEKQERLYEVETDKSIMEVESIETGYVCKITAPTGTTVSVGDQIASITDTLAECG